MYSVVCHEGGLFPPHNYMLLLANLRRVIIPILQRTCGYRRLTNSPEVTQPQECGRACCPIQACGTFLTLSAPVVPCGVLSCMLTCGEHLTRCTVKRAHANS